MNSVTQHYSRDDIRDRIRAALQAANLPAPAPQDLAPLDQFHTGGWNATLELARLAGLQAGERVLDVGGGVGGPARTIASEIGSHVEVLDLTEAFVRAGEMLTELTNMTDQVTFRLGSALDMPYDDATFDAAITQHAAMNIADKATLYREIFRVLKPGGRLALHDIMAGSGTPTYPLPWARTPDISFLQTPESIRALLHDAGFAEIHWEDKTRAAKAWFEERLAAARSSNTPPHLGLHVLLGADSGALFVNLLRGLQENKLRLVTAVLRKAQS